MITFVLVLFMVIVPFLIGLIAWGVASFIRREKL